MRTRIAAIVVVAAGIVLGTSGCNLLAPQATSLHYDASDGVNGSVGDVDVRNAVLVSNDDGDANLIVTFVNTGDSAHNLNVQYTAEGEKIDQSFNVKANSSITLGTDDAPSVIVEAEAAVAGSLFPVYFQYGNETGLELLVPVLDGTLAEYSTLVPTAPPTPAG
ncbi:hypothetical protein [Glaciibacter superstes]|uniref:hypothetical protein n=1 Tax=Glaciibacter superstes TaxID=501023 RepID=UPI0003B30207|nr:hypothetical protein [Glaciibacter superstes]